jgi:hypothetical protein
MRGVETYRSQAGFTVMRLHYSADRDKDPGTQEGAEWLKNELRGIPGGIASSQWRSEMEIDWETTGGELCFPQFDPYRHKIVIPPFEVPESWLLFGSFDYGYRNPSSFHVHALDYDRNIWTVWELYGAKLGYRTLARAIKANPYFEKLAGNPIADPSIWAKNQQVIGGDENQMKSIAELFAEIEDDFDDEFSGPLYFAPGQRGGDATVAERINGDLWSNLDEKPPKWRIFATCPYLIWEISKLRYAEYSSSAAETRNEREEVIDKDNHAWDDFKMFLMQFYYGPERPLADKYERLKLVDMRSWKEWKAVEKLHNEGKDNEGGLD